MYACHYKPSKVGEYVVSATFSEQPIFKSPFNVDVAPERPTKIRAYGPGLHSGVSGHPTSFIVETNGETGGLGALLLLASGMIFPFILPLLSAQNNIPLTFPSFSSFLPSFLFFIPSFLPFLHSFLPSFSSFISSFFFLFSFLLHIFLFLPISRFLTITTVGRFKGLVSLSHLSLVSFKMNFGHFDDVYKRLKLSCTLHCSALVNFFVHFFVDFLARSFVHSRALVGASVFLLCHDIQYNSIQNNKLQYNKIQYNSIQHNKIQYNKIQYNSIQHNSLQYNKIQYNFIHYINIRCTNRQQN